jgi:hypothetical protein
MKRCAQCHGKLGLGVPLSCQTKVSPDDISPAQIENEALWQWPDPTPGVAATRPWQMQVTWPRQIFVVAANVAILPARAVQRLADQRPAVLFSL